MIKKLLAFIAAALVGITITTSPISASADDTRPGCGAWTETIEHPEVSHEETVVVVDEEAYTEVIPGVEAQHYSWTGGHLPTDQPPTEVPPSENWQPNTSQEPHDNGQGNPATWVNESLHYTANSSGHASWFYFTPEVPEQTIEHPAVTHEETVVVVDEEAWTEVVEHEGKDCEEPEQPTEPEDPTEPREPTVDRPEPKDPPAVPTVVSAGL